MLYPGGFLTQTVGDLANSSADIFDPNISPSGKGFAVAGVALDVGTGGRGKAVKGAANEAINGVKNISKEAKTFFENTKYSDKVIRQMNKSGDMYHSFPKIVEKYAAEFGKSSIKTGADGKSYQWLELSGGYRDKSGMFRFIKNASNVIHHRFFKASN